MSATLTLERPTSRSRSAIVEAEVASTSPLVFKRSGIAKRSFSSTVAPSRVRKLNSGSPAPANTIASGGASHNNADWTAVNTSSAFGSKSGGNGENPLSRGMAKPGPRLCRSDTVLQRFVKETYNVRPSV
eukprot:CAMPEP_0119314140 /NCGR_PEP_ID=MMETSP1333-20130426/31813_1 /TAXON_ID=418940 /ORGANISM="Scyphosphaera apsteinii, Strain RCC1455" /LENGTH=129 /DNA_ID=CAMNT_0007319193 /DNA_START=367 /DNA_END=756 /DNA_ORIENTATION=-